MLINEIEVEKRLNNPLNLLNRMRSGELKAPKRSAMSLFTGEGRVAAPNNPTTSNERAEVSFSRSIPATKETGLIVNTSRETSPLPVDSPSHDDIIVDADARIKLTLAHDSALDLLTSSIGALKNKLANNEIKASSIPSIITSASKVVTEIRKERIEREKNQGAENIHYHFYCPTQRKIEEYEIIEVAG